MRDCYESPHKILELAEIARYILGGTVGASWLLRHDTWSRAMSCLKSQPLIVLYPLTFGDEVNFRLTYSGPLKAAGQSETRRLEKLEMRLAFAAQLSGLFKSDELLLKPFSMSGAEYGETVADLAQKYRRGEYSFWPIVRESMHMVCDLDILFLRRGKPGRAVSRDGDLDNRIKVLLMCCACQQMRMRFAVSVLMRTKEYLSTRRRQADYGISGDIGPNFGSRRPEAEK